jgi:iron complex transport system substrate-binding protein
MLSRLVAVITASAAAFAAMPEKPQRIASLNLAADEILVEIVPLERLVAATEAADDPQSSSIVGRIPGSVPRFFRGDLERLVALQPDLVVVSEYTDADFLVALERSGLRYHRMEGLDSMAGYRRALLELGKVVGEPAAAARLAGAYDARLAQIAGRLKDVSRPRVLYWANPFTAGGHTAIGALIECAGGRNVGRELGVEGIVPIGAERAFAADPDLLLVAVSPGNDGREALAAHPLLSQLPAVREGRVVSLPTHLLVSLSHHAAEACDALARQLHPEREEAP